MTRSHFTTHYACLAGTHSAPLSELRSPAPSFVGWIGVANGRPVGQGEAMPGSRGDQESPAITTAAEADLDRREAALRRAGPFGITTADGKYRLWPDTLAWRRGIRWARVDWPDHQRGCSHGAAPDLATALRAIAEHRKEYADG